MLDQQFIRFTRDYIDIQSCEMALPVCAKIPIQFFCPCQKGDNTIRVDIVRPDGTNLKQRITTDVIFAPSGTLFFHVTIETEDFAKILAPNDYFRIKTLTGYFTSSTEGSYGMIHYSNILQFTPDNDGYLSDIRYYCNEPQFGLPFFKKNNIKYEEEVALPILLTKPQFKQTDKIYETRNGEQIVLYATINKEYSGETDYLPEEWHEKIVTALSCDEVYINEERVTKSDSYEIDQDNCTYSPCGIRLTRATFKVKTNITQRNSNC